MTEDIIKGTILAIISGIWFVAWYYRIEIIIWLKKQKIKLFPVPFNLAFSIDSKEWLNSGHYYKEIIKNFNKLIDENNLWSLVKVIDFSDVYKFNSQKEAENFLNNKDLDLIIWWDFSWDNLKKNWENISKLNFKVTYKTINDSEWWIKKVISSDISSKIAEKNYNNWIIQEKESFEQVISIWNNLFDIALYIISISLKFSWNLDKSTKILEKHFDCLQKRKDVFIRHIYHHLINNYFIFVLDILYSVNKYRNKYKLWRDYCEKMLKLEQDNVFAITNIAYFEYKLWNVQESKKYVSIVKQKDPNSHTSIINIAFFYVLEKQYKNAFKWYEKLVGIKTENLKVNIIDVTEFLDAEYQKIWEKWFLYVIWFLNFHFWDKCLAKKDLEKFIKVSNNNEMKYMYRNAKKLLKLCKE